jgi:hypothetical protein
MYSPAQAILWQISWRARWGLFAAAAFLLLAILLSHLLPKHWTIQFDVSPVPAVGWFLGVSSVFVNIMLVAVFSMSGADARDLTFSKHMFVLPVRTSTLVAWPMLSGCLTVAAVWLLNACLVFRSGGIAAPLWWPAAALALFLATFQALSWTPFVQRWLHVVWTAGVLMSPLFAILLGLIFDVRLSEPTGAAILVGLIPVAYVAALSGVGRARRGDPYDWRAWGRFVEWIARRRPAATHPFRSLSRAQLWYECRSQVIVPIFIACMMPCFLFVPAIERSNVELGWQLLGILLGAPLLVGMLAGGALGNLTDPLSKHEAAAFVLVRPISTLSLIKGKLVLAAIVTAAIWILFLAYISLLLLRPGFPQSIARVAGSAGAWKAVGFPVLVLALLIALTWENMVESFWVTLTGRKWVEVANSFGWLGLLFAGFGIGLWIYFHPELHTVALAAVPWLIGLLLVIKLTAATFVVRGLIHSRLAGPCGAGMMIAAWLAVVVALCGLALSLLPSEFAPATKIVPGVALFVPFARLAGAPLALEWNRHR